MQREVRFSSSRPIEHESVHSRQTSDSCLQRILDLPLPKINHDMLYDQMDPWTSASLNGFKPDVEIGEDQQKIEIPIKLDIDEASSSNDLGWTPLMYSAYLGHIESTKRLLSLKVNVEQCNLAGQTALMLASTCGNDQMVRLLLEYTKNTGVRDKVGRTALHYAILYGQNTLAEPLLKHGFDPNLPDLESGMTPMLIACKSGRMTLVDELLKHNGNPRLNNKKGQNGEALAAAGEYEDVIKRLQWHNKLHALFEKEGLTKYLINFEQNQISERKFCQLTSQTLNDMGINLLGPQKKIECLAQELRKKLTMRGGNVRSNESNRLRQNDNRLGPVENTPIRNGSPSMHPGPSNGSGSNNNAELPDPNNRDLRGEHAYRQQLMVNQLSHQYALNEQIVRKLKEIREVVIGQNGVDSSLRAIIQAIDDSNAKTLALLRE